MYRIVSWSFADEEPGNCICGMHGRFGLKYLNTVVTPNNSLSADRKSVITSKLDKVVEAIYSRMDDGMVLSDITSPDTTICILSGELVFFACI